MDDEARKAFEAWLAQGNSSGCNESMWKAWQAALATQPQAPQGAVTDAERYEFLCTVTDEVTMDFIAECIGSRKHLDAFVDELIKERRAAPETPEGKK